jgi:hypothetical protein
MATEIHARPDWMQVMNEIVEIASGGTWRYDKIVVILRGLPGSGKSTLVDLLVHELRSALRFSEQRFVRVCSSSFNQVLNGVDSQQLTLADFTSSLRYADVVILDDVNILETEWSPFITAADGFFGEGEPGCGVICAVTFACRDEDHAFRLCGRSWRQLHDGEVREYYEALRMAPEIGYQGIQSFWVDPDI